MCLRWGRRGLFLAGLFSIFMAFATGANAQASKFFSGATAESTVSRLSDAEVRELLLQRLQPDDATNSAQPESFNPAVFAYRLQRDSGKIAEELDGIFGSVAQLPSVFPRAWARFSADREAGGLVWFFGALLISMGAAGLLEYAVWRRLRATPAFERADAAAGLRARAGRLGLMFLVRAGLLAIFLAWRPRFS